MTGNPTDMDSFATNLDVKHSLQLAIETTSRAGSVALFSNDCPVRSVSLDPTRRSAATITTVIESVISDLRGPVSGSRGSEQRIQLISIAAGPGSFTGLRIGVTTAKTLSYALHVRLVAVDSLAAIAAAQFDANPSIDEILVALDAYRGQVFEGRFQRATLLPPIDSDLSGWSALPDDVRVRPMAEFQGDLNRDVSFQSGTLSIAGDAKPFGALADRRMEPACDAIGVGLLGLLAAAKGDFVSPMELVPRYLKASSAEEKAAETG
ncbi:tRNA (adenosine(37)-N6)-threonylcarbamoyltransferase complex dimerization subunit type 1 TsaB [Rubripirellula reticaptiva]|uniref:N(6)-L-threonylcarbamoyladenine synthase n=1 Tax=Rubripirellula reticaptiva TaxID=2528013 RepID=A0A5C6EQV1_9BACT|nr:tRNA (adenosine(37)-N6)-threonylcarbamoyltransferase complex dimerization subunit type 1 TsaB [Rubripirellula reticaptiva]TWU51318.1 tRNA threonylcarbamoyladenosine biosynthesis protein TsaB [Rubripirellula reticaptiva]